LIEQGTHDSLLADEDGAYWALVNAQKLSMGESFAAESDLVESTKPEILEKIMSTASGVRDIEEEAPFKKMGFFHAFGLFMLEQKQHWKWYVVLTIGCIGAACKSFIISLLASFVVPDYLMFNPNITISPVNYLKSVLC
jgi:ATP-binding cassette subfamily B (MDR/TAP) protein 1